MFAVIVSCFPWHPTGHPQSCRFTHDLPEEGLGSGVVCLQGALPECHHVRLVGEVEQPLAALRVQLGAVLGEPVLQRKRLLRLPSRV